MSEQNRRRTNAGRCLMRMWIIAGLLVGGGVVSCDRQEEAVASAETQQANRRARSKPRGNRMVKAYKSGDIEKAREEARRRLAQRHRDFLKAKSDSDRYGWISAVFGVLHNMLHFENQLPPEVRLGDDPEFASWIQEVLLETWGAAGDIDDASVGMQRHIKRLQRNVAREWLRARAARVPREALEELYFVFESVLKGQGLDSVDSVLAYQPPEPPSRPEPRKIDHHEAAKITAAIQSYYTGLATSDVELVQSATECTPEECQFFFKELQEEAAEEGWQSIKGVILPRLTDEQLLLRTLPWGERTYRISFSNVTFNLLLPNGDEIEQTGNKSWTVRDKGDGKWIVLPFK